MSFNVWTHLTGRDDRCEDGLRIEELQVAHDDPRVGDSGGKPS